ncbi:MAG: SPOR domain-containing protein, partial [Bacteroidales bacterium]|nr:SPOR domain-containing protein [Bacteroidales bacterium]
NIQSAKINQTQNSFSPPYKEISFNRDLKHNDGLLIGYVSRAKNIGFVDAKRLVDSFVKNLNIKLNKGKKVVIEDVGVLQMDKEKNIQFEPSNTINFLLDSYGLGHFNFDPLEEYDVTKRIQKKFEERSPASLSRRRTLRRLAIAIPVAVALVLIPLKTNMLDFNADISSLNPFSKTEQVQPKTESTVSEKPIIEKTDIKKPVAIEETEKTAETPAKTIAKQSPVSQPEKPVADLQYYIIAGSFLSENNAHSMKNQLTGQGFDPIVFKANNDFYRVGIKGYSSIDLAIKEMREMRKKQGFEQVWVTKYK